MIGPIRIKQALSVLLGQFAEAVLHGRATIGDAELEFKMPFGIRCDRVGTAARISINPAPTVAVSGWPDPDLAYIDVFPNGTAKIIAKGKLLTYTVEVLPK